MPTVQVTDANGGITAFTYDERGNQLTEVELYNGKKTTTVTYECDADGNRVFQLNYNLHTDEDWKGNNDNGNGSNKGNSGIYHRGQLSGRYHRAVDFEPLQLLCEQSAELCG